MRIDAKTVQVRASNSEVVLQFHTSDAEPIEVVMGVELARWAAHNLNVALFNQFKLIPRG